MRTQVRGRQALGTIVAAVVLAVASTVGWGAGALDVMVEIANTADPTLFGATVYEFSAAVFMKDASSISIRSFYPFLVVAPGQTRQLGPFELEETPNALILLGRKGPPGPTMDSLAVTIAPLFSGVVYEEEALRITVRFGEEPREDQVSLTGYILSFRQFWCSRSEGPLYLLQTTEFGLGLDGFYVLVRGPRWPWEDDPLLESLTGKNVQVRGRLVSAGEEVWISVDRSATYLLPALIVEEIHEIELRERCGF